MRQTKTDADISTTGGSHGAERFFPRRALLFASVLLASCAAEPRAGTGNVPVHDPSILKARGRYYLYGSHMSAAASDDLRNWRMLAMGYSEKNPVYGRTFDARDDAFAYAGSAKSLIPTDDGTTHVWAPDVIYNKRCNKYFMYGCVSSTWKASNLCCWTADSPEGPFVWRKPLLYSGFSRAELPKTDVLAHVDGDHAEKNYLGGGEYNFRDFPNALDPNVFYDASGRLWMVYGSWSGGIFILPLDARTGDVAHPKADPEKEIDPYFGRRLLGGGHVSIEGPYVMYCPASKFYYLFVSYGRLERNGGYQIRVFRSASPDGPYADMNGKRPAKGARLEDYGLKLSGNHALPGIPRARMSTGHNSAFIDRDGRMYVVFHTRFSGKGSGFSARVHQMMLNSDGWPCMLPYRTNGEKVSGIGYRRGELAGAYSVVCQGTDISGEIAEPKNVMLNADGTLSGEGCAGTWSARSGTPFMDITLDGIRYRGIFCRMKDESDNRVMVFSAAGANTSLWGVKRTSGTR